MKGHRLLETCNKDQPDKLPQVGELVWAKVLGHAYWPGFILKLTDLDNTDVESNEFPTLYIKYCSVIPFAMQVASS